MHLKVEQAKKRILKKEEIRWEIQLSHLCSADRFPTLFFFRLTQGLLADFRTYHYLTSLDSRPLFLRLFVQTSSTDQKHSQTLCLKTCSSVSV